MVEGEQVQVQFQDREIHLTSKEIQHSLKFMNLCTVMQGIVQIHMNIERNLVIMWEIVKRHLLVLTKII